METTHQNKEAWNVGAYQAWVNRFGNPSEAAMKIKHDPAKRIGKALDYMGEIQERNIVNLLGSNANKAVALALMGASVTVVDFSTENEKYALELAAAADVHIRYIVSDVLQLPDEVLTGSFDIVYMEHGILHYFTDLHALFHVVNTLLRPGGVLVTQDFHPVSTKLLSSRGTTATIRKHKITGNYFDASIEEKEISFSKFLSDRSENVQKVLLRNWTLGEIITSIASCGLYIRVLEELPNQSSDVFDKGIPKTFIILAEKRG
ncbi:class I SAM-dependent methyltransferase [Paenibacillus ginsengarvi]|uniref:Class I SAM-dependent methyltransferase n=1 Tax=Paenibacillus ginsengarvi TaxID=400777 RepID=A0A3B0BDW0_9BACL|nr:class I SAM-dependent methyltransferase [Paenibacillus ginsengarvi]RKN70621.1 class I SAM-dependent methyltransferase [Paenibacillus ginsengarvi]